jgi:hypothetical protein
MLSSLSSTIITVFGISHLLESPVGSHGGRAACPDSSDSATRKLVPIRYRNANSDLRASQAGAFALSRTRNGRYRTCRFRILRPRPFDSAVRGESEHDRRMIVVGLLFVRMLCDCFKSRRLRSERQGIRVHGCHSAGQTARGVAPGSAVRNVRSWPLARIWDTVLQGHAGPVFSAAFTATLSLRGCCATHHPTSTGTRANDASAVWLGFNASRISNPQAAGPNPAPA